MTTTHHTKHRVTHSSVNRYEKKTRQSRLNATIKPSDLEKFKVITGPMRLHSPLEKTPIQRHKTPQRYGSRNSKSIVTQGKMFMPI